MVDLVAEVNELLAAGPHGAREAEMRIAAARVPLDERLWLLRAVALSSGQIGLRDSNHLAASSGCTHVRVFAARSSTPRRHVRSSPDDTSRRT